MRDKAKYVTRNREYVNKIKYWSDCEDCGYNFAICAMDFDHVRGVKKGAISQLVQKGCSLETLKEEIAKCEIVCSNCHRVRTAERREND